MLQQKNKHPRDLSITIDTKNHQYWLSYNDTTKKPLLSVTQYVKKLFPTFCPKKTIQNMKNKNNWEKSKYYKMSETEIIKQWEDIRNNAVKKGIMMHKNIEYFYNKETYTTNTKEFRQFKKFCDDHKDLIPWRTEMMIWDDTIGLGGTVDMIFKTNDNKLVIFDWKRSKKINIHNYFKKFATHPLLKDIPDTNYWHYCIQLNIYRWILEKHYYPNQMSNQMYIVVFHEINDNYKKFKIKDMRQIIDKLFSKN